MRLGSVLSEALRNIGSGVSRAVRHVSRRVALWNAAGRI